VIIGSPEWVTAHAQGHRQHVADKGDQALPLMRYLEERVWERIRELHAMGGLRYRRVRGERAPGRSNAVNEIEMPEVWAECDVVNRALRSLRSVWPEGHATVCRSLRDRLQAGETRRLGRAKRFLANAILQVGETTGAC